MSKYRTDGAIIQSSAIKLFKKLPAFLCKCVINKHLSNKAIIYFLIFIFSIFIKIIIKQLFLSLLETQFIEWKLQDSDRHSCIVKEQKIYINKYIISKYLQNNKKTVFKLYIVNAVLNIFFF